MRPTPRLRGLPLFGFAVAGLLLGHAVSYLLAIPDPAHRDLILQRTGHEYLPAAGEAAVIVALAGIAAVFVRAWSGRGRAEPEGFGPLAAVLAVVQVLAFVAQEVAERLVTHAPLGELVHDHVLATGIVVQLAIALVGAAGLRLLARASARIADAAPARIGSPRPAVAIVPADRIDRPAGAVAGRPPSVRAPPSA